MKKAALKNNQIVKVKAVNDDVYRGMHGDIAIPGYQVTLTSFVRIFVPADINDVKDALKAFKKEKAWMDFYHLKEHVADLRPVFASTVHKSQGSTYSHVFIDLDDIGRCNITDDVARMLYVAISRAKRNVYLVGDLPEKYGGKPYVAP